MAELVIDIGMHVGDDTARYLAHGFDVVAVDANPALCEAARNRFATEIADGRLAIRDVGVSDTAGELTFWVSENSQFSSFSREWVSRHGTAAEPVDVPVLRFSDLVNEYRKALYVKIDVEGWDARCVQELEHCKALPDYVSFELPDLPDFKDCVATLGTLGYNAFKCVRQNDWDPITADRWRRYVIARRFLGLVYPVCMRLPAALRDPLAKAYNRLRGIDDGRWELASSGPLPIELPGRWITGEEAIELARRCFALGALPWAKRLPADWFDIHARHDSAA